MPSSTLTVAPTASPGASFSRRAALFALALLAALTYLFLWRLWAAAPEDRATFPTSDLTEVFYPPRRFAAHTLRAGELPLWNPHVYAGYPQFADPQAATFYPPQLALALLAGDAFSLNTLAVSAALHFWLAGALTLLFLRRRGLGLWPALLGAVAFEFGGYLTGFVPLQFSELEAAVWLPGALLALSYAVAAPRLPRTLCAGLIFSLVFLAGRPQSYLSIAPICLAWFGFTAWRAGWPRRALAAHLLAFGAAALAGAVAQWLPTLQLTRLSTRAAVLYTHVAHGGFQVDDLAALLNPGLADALPVFVTLYSGVLTLALAALAVRRRRGLFWAALAGLFLLAALGQRVVTLDALYLLQRLSFPGYLRDVERLALGVNFCLAVLAALGLEQLRRAPAGWARAGRAALLGVLAVTVAAVALRLLLPPGPAAETATRFYRAAWWVTLFAGLGALAVWLAGARRGLAQAALVGLVALDLLSLNQGRFYEINAPADQQLTYLAAAPVGRDPFYRLAADQLSGQDFGSVLGLDGVWGMPPLTLKRYARLIEQLDQYRRNILLNVEVVATTGEYHDPAYAPAGENGPFRYYRFVPAHQRAYLVQHVRAARDDDEAAALLAAPNFDHWNTAVVVGAPALDDRLPLGRDEGAQITSRTANTLRLSVQAAAPRLLVIANAAYPGWRAWVDDQPADLLPTNLALQGLLVPAGAHTVMLRFQPLTFYLGASASLLAWLSGWLWLALAERARRSPPPSTVALPAA
ncbi:MAG: hypothetical protein IT317_23890 [Anaerolineales bacterium]|nr:hypothetical protein [Anaerolineales bacterium]